EDAVAREEAAHRRVHFGLRVQRVDDVAGDAELFAKRLQSGSVRLAAGERFAIAHREVQVSLEDRALLRRDLRIERLRDQAQRSDDFRRQLQRLEVRGRRLDQDLEVAALARKLDVELA